MTLKTTQFRFQVSAADGVSAQATISMDGVQLWAGSLAHTRDMVEPQQWTNDDTPYSGADCEIDMPDTVSNTPAEYSKLFTIFVRGGTAVLVGINQTNNPKYGQEPNPKDPSGPMITVYVGGNPNLDDNWEIITQPLWDGVADLSRYDISKNLGVSGPGCLPIRNGETCEFSANLWSYCPVVV